MSSFEALLGDTLRAPDGSTSPTRDLIADADVVGLYFSAHWCPPCRGFTPVLAERYKTYRTKGLKVQIVFVSSDKDEAAFTDYADTMPWVSLPFSDRDRKTKLSSKYKVSGIPTLVLLDKHAELITKDGRTTVADDEHGDLFPWSPPSLHDMLGDSFVGADGASVAATTLSGKTLGLYFSAHWCPPCRGFTPKLVDTYKTLQTSHPGQFEIVFVSSDRDEAAFTDYFADMPWLALPFKETQRKKNLSARFGVEGIPSFVVVDFDSGDVINADARGSVEADPAGAKFPWVPPPVRNLSSPDGINTTPSVIVFAGAADPATQTNIEREMAAVAKPVMDAAKTRREDPPMLFFLSTDNDDHVASQVCRLTKCDPKDAVKAVVLDIQDGQAYYHPQLHVGGEGVTELWLRGLVADFEAKKLTRHEFE